MSEIFPSLVTSNLTLLSIVASAIVAAVGAYFLYSKTVPPVSAKMRYFLAIARCSALFLVLILFFAPALTIIWQQPQKEKIIIAADRSGSMGLENRSELLESTVTKLQEKLSSEYRLITYAFDIDTMKFNSDSTLSGENGTDIDAALRKISKGQSDAAAIILISDGNISAGRNPLYSEQLHRVPIYAIGVGDTVSKPDLMVANVKANKIVYEKKTAVITAEVSAFHAGNITTTVKLKQSGKAIAARPVNLNSDQGVRQVEFEIIPPKTGLLSYQLEIDPIPGEIILNNNTAQVSMECIRSGLKIGFLASRASYDVKFIKFLLQRVEDFEVISSTGSRGSKIFDKKPEEVISTADVLILYDFPGKTTSSAEISRFNELTKQRRIPVLKIASGNDPISTEQQFYKNLGNLAIQLNRQKNSAQAEPSVQGKLNPIINVFSDTRENQLYWEKCPPILYNFSRIEADSPPRSILQIKGLPVLAEYQSGGIRNLLLFGSGFWKWHFQMTENLVYRDGWNLILQNMVRWLSRSAGNQNVIISSDQKILQPGERTLVEVQVYDASSNPVTDGSVSLEFDGPTGAYSRISENSGNGIYIDYFTAGKTGNYTINAQAFRNDILLGTAQLNLVVNPVEKEFLYTRQNTHLLKNLARKTGGEYYQISSMENLYPVLPDPYRTQTIRKEIEIWNRFFVLIVIILLFSIEWIIRKQKNLA